MERLHFPPFEYKLSKKNESLYIWDRVRKKYVKLTPEEWVRQHVVHFFIEHLDYPRTLIKVESGLHYHQRQKRSDIVVYHRDGSVFLLTECKAATVPVTAKAALQVGVYGSTLKTDYTVLTNGKETFVFNIDHERKTASLMQDFPGKELI